MKPAKKFLWIKNHSDILLYQLIKNLTQRRKNVKSNLHNSVTDNTVLSISN